MGFLLCGGGLLLGGLYLAIAVGLWRLRYWARIALLILIPLGIVATVINMLVGDSWSGGTVVGLVLNGFVLYWLAEHGEYFTE